MVNTKSLSRSDAALIAFHLGCSVKRARQLSGSESEYSDGLIFNLAGDHFCVVASGAPLPVDQNNPNRWNWEAMATYTDKVIYRSAGNK